MREVRSKIEYEDLCDEIWHHNRCYFQEAAPEISDEEFDSLVKVLEHIEQLHPEWISPTSPTQRVGERPLEGFSEIVHDEPMLSLEKAFERKELEAFYDRVCRLVDKPTEVFYGELKMDGLAISITYEKGQLVRAVTRGDGRVGSDITQNIKTLRGIPLRIPRQFETLEVRGEVFLPRESFHRMNQEREKAGLPLWANPRNAAAGSLKLLDSRELSKREGLSCVLYGIARQDPIKVHFQHDLIPFLHSLGLPTYLSIPGVPSSVLQQVRSVDDMMRFQDSVRKIRAELPFDIDGVVFKMDALDVSSSIAPTLKHPRTAIAWKFNAEQVWTRLTEIVVQVGRTGVITPVAELEPVEVSGSVVSRATLHNADEIVRKDIRPGDRVLVEKGGDVIPKVVSADTTLHSRGPAWSMPKLCPSCGTELVRDIDAVALRCPNHEACPEQVIRSLCHFVGKEGLDIENVGEKTIRALYNKGLVKAPHDLFLLTKEQLLSLEGIKDKSAENILKGILQAKTPPLDRFLLALGIKSVGVGTARRLAQLSETLDGFLNFSYEAMLSIDGIGDEVASSVVSSLQNLSFRHEIVALKAACVSPSPIERAGENIGHALHGATFVLTGTLQTMTRSDAAKKIQACGGIVSETVSKKTSFVVVGSEPGSKLTKAQALGIKILTEEDFLSLVQ